MSQTPVIPAPQMAITKRSRAEADWALRPRALIMRHGALAFAIVAIVGAYHFTLGARDLGLFLLGFSGLQLLGVALYVGMLSRKSGNHNVSERRNLDLVVGSSLTLACGILTLAGGIFILLKGLTPPYNGEFNWLEIQWGGVVLGLVLGPMAILAYALQYLERHFIFSLLCTIAVVFSASYLIGVIGALLSVSAVTLLVFAKDEFLD